jgi:hypothetical protein
MGKGALTPRDAVLQQRPYVLHDPVSGAVRIAVRGRDRWALECLIAAGAEGCTPIDQPGPRWSAYVHNLRALGLRIDTLHEAHGGPFPGRHGRYVLRSRVERVAAEPAGAGA